MARKHPEKPRFEQLVTRVRQAEDALEAQERGVVTDLRKLKSSWRAAWTPWRIVVAGLASGFVVGRAEPMRALGKSGGLIQMVSMAASLFAGGSAKVAAKEAAETKEQVQAEGEGGVAFVGPAMTAPADAPTARPAAGDPGDEALALAQAEARARAARTTTVDQVGP